MCGSSYRRFGKRLFDLVISIALLVPLILLGLLVAILVRASLGSPVLFRQLRPGLNRKPFVLWKFRSMTDATDQRGNLRPDAERLTAVGRFLRQTSLDELPELLNVLRGDMSLVGPRPLLMEYLPLYSHRQTRRHEVRPGLTGWAQIQGRNALTWPEKFEADVWYVDNVSFLLDVRILARTVFAVLSARGISQPGTATAMPFTGNGDREHDD